MMTYFVAKMLQENQSLAEFALTCARGMGLLTRWRNCEELPEPLTGSAYYAETLARVEEEAREEAAAARAQAWLDELRAALGVGE